VGRMSKEPLLIMTLLLVLAGLGFFVLYPMVSVLTYPAIRDFLIIPENERYVRAIYNTFFMVLLSTSSAVTVGFLFAYTFSRTDVPLKRVFRIISLLPLFSPPFMIAFSYVLMFGRNGLISYTLFGHRYDIIGWHGLWLSETIAFFPMAALIMEGVLQSISPSLEYAGRNLGATGWKLFRSITFPLARPGVAGAALLVAIYVLADFGNPIMIAGSFIVLPTEAWSRVSGWGDVNGAAVLTSILLLPAFLFFLVQRYWVGRRQYTTITGKVTLLEMPRTKWYVRWALFTFCTVFSILILCIFFGLVAGAFTKGWGFDYTPTLKHWQRVFSFSRPLGNSLYFALIAALVSSSLAMVSAYLVSRKEFPGKKVLDFVAILPAAIPGVFFGIGYSLSFNVPPFDLYGTSLIIILSMIFWNIPMGYQTAFGGFQQIAVSLGEAASNLGAGSLRILWDIELPLLKSAYVSAFVVSFIRAVTTLSVIIFLVTSTNIVATFRILNLVNDGFLGEAAALTAALLFLTFVILCFARFLFGRKIELFRI
jgi:iron(III) transport system permease protein